MFITVDKKVILGLYVDDMIIMGKDPIRVDKIVQGISNRWEIKDLGDIKQILGLQVHRDRGQRSLTIDQTTYIRGVIKRFGQEDSQPIGLPATDRNGTARTEVGEAQADQVKYQQLIGCLIWISKGTRPDIAWIAGQLSQHNNNPSTRHWNCAIRVLRYLKGTSDVKLMYGIGTQNNLQGYCDSDYAGDTETRKSTLGHLYMLNSGPITWNSEKQRCVAMSTTEAEYISLAEASKQGQWIRGLMKELCHTNLLETNLAVPIYSDNQACIALSQDLISHKRTKHIDVRHHYIRQLVTYGKAAVSYISTKDMIADILTKPLPKPAFEKCRDQLVQLKTR